MNASPWFEQFLNSKNFYASRVGTLKPTYQNPINPNVNTKIFNQGPGTAIGDKGKIAKKIKKDIID